MGAARRQSRGWQLMAAGQPVERHFEAVGGAVGPVARPVAAVTQPGGVDALAGLVGRLEAALARLEAIGGAGGGAVAAVVAQVKRPAGGLKVQLLSGAFVPVAAELDELAPVAEVAEVTGDGDDGQDIEAQAEAEYAGEDRGLVRYDDAQRAVRDAVDRQLRLHGKIDAEQITDALAEQYDLPDALYEPLFEEVRGRIEMYYDDVLEAHDRDDGGRAYTWRVTEPGDVCSRLEIRSLRDISGDAFCAWREMVGHWLYRQTLQHKGLAAAEKAYGQFADVDWDKRRDWITRGDRSARISAGLQGRALWRKGQAAALAMHGGLA